MGILREFLRCWKEYLCNEGLKNLKDDFERDIAEVVYLFKSFFKMMLDISVFLGGIVVILVEYALPFLETWIVVLILLIKSILFILDKIVMGFLSLWDEEEYKKIKSDRWNKRK